MMQTARVSIRAARPELRFDRLHLNLVGMIFAVLVTLTAWAQDMNPYGRIDPAEVSISVLQRSVGGLGNPGSLEQLIKSEAPGVDLLLEGLLDHQDPRMRVVAGRALIARGADPVRIMKRVGDTPTRSALVVSLFGDDLIDSKVAETLLEADPQISPAALAILHASVPAPAVLAVLADTIGDDSLAEVADGIVAVSLEQERPGSVAAWLKELDDRPNRSTLQKDRILFEVLAIASKLQIVESLAVIAETCEKRPSDDALRASAILSQMEQDPERGVPAWSRLAEATPASRLIPTALLLVIAEAPAPSGLGDRLSSDNPLPAAVRTMVLARPEDRLDAAREVVSLGHLPTIRWILNRDVESIPVELASEILTRAVAAPSGSMTEAGIVAATRLGTTDPEALSERIKEAVDAKDIFQASMLLEGLIRSRTPAAAAVATEFIQSPQRNLRSLALLAAANGGELEGTSVRRLGRAAAGGGGLPEGLRPLAAWHYLRLQNQLDESIPAVLDF